MPLATAMTRAAIAMDIQEQLSVIRGQDAAGYVENVLLPAAHEQLQDEPYFRRTNACGSYNMHDVIRLARGVADELDTLGYVTI